MIKGYSFSGFEQYEQRFERLLIPARRRCSSFTMSIWHSPPPILVRSRGPRRVAALLRTSVGNRLMVDKPLGQLELPIRVKHVTVLSPRVFRCMTPLIMAS